MSGEKTEAATPHQLEKLRDDGKVARSTDLTAAIGLIAGFAILQSSGQAMAQRMQDVMTTSLTDMALGSKLGGPLPGDDAMWAGNLLTRVGEGWIMSMVPLLVALPMLAIGISFAQGAVFSHKALWSMEKINPLSGFKRMFSMNALIELFRASGKVTVVGWVTYGALESTLRKLPSVMSSTDPMQIGSFLSEASMGIALSGAQVLLVLAMIDFAYQRWNFAKEARMSIDDVKQEHKQQDGDPLLKSQIRQRQREMASKRQLQNVPSATVVVTNPTHFAVALQYDRNMRSPKVVAKGADLVAQRIKQIAAESGVPIVENKPLARGLYAAVEVGDDIPLELYQMVAEVLAYVFSRKKQRARA